VNRLTQDGLRYGAYAGFVAVGVALLSTALWTGGPVRAAVQSETSASEDYASPLEVLLSPDGARLFVLCQQSNEVRVLNAASFAAIKNIAVGHVPRGFSLSPKGDKLFVTNAWDDTISVIDTKALEVINTWPVGAEPSSVVEDRAGKRLFVANRISNDIAVLDAQTGVEEKRLAAGRGASYLALSPDGSRIYVTHVYPKIVPRQTGFENRLPPESEPAVAGQTLEFTESPQSEIGRPWSVRDLSPEYQGAVGAEGMVDVAVPPLDLGRMDELTSDLASEMLARFRRKKLRHSVDHCEHRRRCVCPVFAPELSGQSLPQCPPSGSVVEQEARGLFRLAGEGRAPGAQGPLAVAEDGLHGAFHQELTGFLSHIHGALTPRP